MPRKETAMNEMIERVARAMIKPLGHDPAKDWARTYVGGGCDDLTDNSLKALCMDLARAAIEAMRDPTDAMVTAGDTTFADYEGWGPPRETWPRMIDAALSNAA